MRRATRRIPRPPAPRWRASADDYRAIAERRVRLGLLLSEIGQKNGVEISQQEMNQLIMQAAQQYRPEDRQRFVEYVRSEPMAAAQLRAPLFEDKVVDFLFGKAEISEREVTREELEAAIESEERPRPRPGLRPRPRSCAKPKKAAKKPPRRRRPAGEEARPRSRGRRRPRLRKPPAEKAGSRPRQGKGQVLDVEEPASLTRRERASRGHWVPGEDQRSLRTLRIAVLLPCYNEEAAIAQTVAGFRAALPDAAHLRLRQ